MSRRAPPAARLLPAACAAALVLLILLIVSRDYPLVGHDHRYYVPRLLDTALHLHLTGLTIQWYTPSFGGGLPAFPNPQHLQHSLVQAVSYVTSPWIGILVSTAVYALVGFSAFFRYLSRSIGVHSLPAALGAIGLVANGFYIEHMIVGHVGFQVYPLGALLLSALTQRGGAAVRHASVIALTLAVMVFQAGIHIVFLLALSLTATLPVLYLVRRDLIDPKRIAAVLAMALGLTLAITASKIFAVLAFMRQFPREVADVYAVPLAQGLIGLGAQLLGAMVLVPIAFVARFDPAVVAAGLSRITGASLQVGIWELDTGLSPAVIACLVVAVLQGCRTLWVRGRPTLDRGQILALVALGIVTWLLIETTLARGVVYPLVKEWPILRSLHVNHRVAAAFILPLTVIGVVWLDRWYAQAQNRAVMGTLLCLALLSPLSYLLLPARVHLRTFDLRSTEGVAERIRAGDTFAVDRIADLDDAQALAGHASSYRPYEPLFGYGLEAFAAEIAPGPAREVRDGSFNMTNPASLVFPEINNVRPFERFRVDERDRLESFLARRQPAWEMPPIVAWLNAVSILAVAGCLVALALARKWQR